MADPHRRPANGFVEKEGIKLYRQKREPLWSEGLSGLPLHQISVESRASILPLSPDRRGAG